MSQSYEKIKRLIDITVASAALTASAPLLLSIAMLIKFESPGFAIFRQKRLGKDGTIFEILKFRTMYSGASVVIGEDNTVLNQSNDDRITKVGKLLRKTSIDELPQLINVLLGEMSLIGPRPDLPSGLEVYNEHQQRKLAVRPGITGLAQVSGRNMLTAEEKWALDVEYVNTMGLKIDLTIMAKTVAQILARKGVYKG